MIRGGATVACLIALVAGCTTPGEQGERRYREGDRRAALETWRSVGRASHEYEAVQERIAAVESEFEQLVVRYKKRAAYFENQDRLAEAALNHRLALELRPEDREALGHLQQLVRELATRKSEETEAYAEAFAQGDLALARQHLETRQRLDPFDVGLASDQRRLREALQSDVEALLANGRRDFAAAHYEVADRSFAAVLELDPENDTARGYRSFIRDLEGERARGRAGSSATSAAPTLAQVRAEGFYQNAIAAEHEGRPYDAIRHDLRAAALDPEHRKSRLHLASIRRSLAPEVPELIESGRRYYQQEDLNSALDQWRRVLLIDPGHGEAQDYVARAERLLENLEQLRAEVPASGLP